jgi:hypothetical protein
MPEPNAGHETLTLGYTVQIVKHQIFGRYHGIVKLDGEEIGRVPLLALASLSREGVIQQAQRFAETHAESNQPEIPLNVRRRQANRPRLNALGERIKGIPR